MSTESTNRQRARREFIQKSARMAAGMAVVGIGLGLYARQARSRPGTAIRPPGALADDNFTSACVRCGLCVRACPFDTLKLARFGEGMAVGTPYFTARDVPCEMCDDIPSVAACPSGALSKQLKNIDNAKMGVAVIVDQENCLNYLGLRCDVCYRVCPLINKAIRLDMQHNPRTGKHALFIPVVSAEHCTGCGKCEKGCVLPKAAIKVLPVHLARGAPAKHYRTQPQATGGLSS